MSCSSSFQTACWEAVPIRTSHEFCITTNDELICDLNPGPEKFPTASMFEGIAADAVLAGGWHRLGDGHRVLEAHGMPLPVPHLQTGSYMGVGLLSKGDAAVQTA